MTLTSNNLQYSNIKVPQHNYHIFMEREILMSLERDNHQMKYQWDYLWKGFNQDSAYRLDSFFHDLHWSFLKINSGIFAEWFSRQGQSNNFVDNLKIDHQCFNWTTRIFDTNDKSSNWSKILCELMMSSIQNLIWFNLGLHLHIGIQET
jgi:hypothetical protein